MEVNVCDERNECDHITAVELQKFKRLLYFSDGVMEELSESEEEDIVKPDLTDIKINLASLSFGHQIKYRIYQLVTDFLNGVNFVGEGLANIFGITAPKLISEYDIGLATSADPQMNDLHSISHPDDVSGWAHHDTNTSNIVITRFLQNT